jgi:serine/threonine-protein kinase
MANGAPAPPYEEAALAALFPTLANIQFVTAGGEKAVYRATHAQHGAVALKVLAHGADHERAMREIEAVKHIQVPQVPAIFAFGTVTLAGGNPIWFMERWLPGQSLRTHLASGTVTDDLIRIVARDVLTALLAAERQHIVHRDVKPENIMVHPACTACTLVDFGIARHLMKDSLTLTKMPWAACTPGYAPPEQFENLKSEIDGRADLFALGVTLYECIEGANPFLDGASDASEVLQRVKTISLANVSRNLDAAGNLTQLIAAMTRTRRTHRVRSVSNAKAWFDTIQF